MRRAPLALRLSAYATGVVIGVIASLVIGEVRAPEMPLWGKILIGIVAGSVGGFLLEKVFASFISDLRTARLGSMKEKKAAAGRAVTRFENRVARIAVAIEAGDLARASELLSRLARLARGTRPVRLLEARYDLARGDDDAIDRLLLWQLHISPLVTNELERYHAYVLAQALVRDVASSRARIAAERLLRHRDPEVRGYGAWLVAFDGSSPLTVETRDLVTGAGLARGAGLEEVAIGLESRVAKAASEKQNGPYRA